VEMNLFSQQENKNSTKKKDSLMNLQDVLIVEELKKNKITEDNSVLFKEL